jgi:hypothetical protein
MGGYCTVSEVLQLGWRLQATKLQLWGPNIPLQARRRGVVLVEFVAGEYLTWIL